MKEIKTKAAANTPKILETAVRMPRKAKDNLLKARDKVKETEAHNQGEQPERYATDQTTRGASTVVQKNSGVIRTLVNRLDGEESRSGSKKPKMGQVRQRPPIHRIRAGKNIPRNIPTPNLQSQRLLISPTAQDGRLLSVTPGRADIILPKLCITQ